MRGVDGVEECGGAVGGGGGGEEDEGFSDEGGAPALGYVSVESRERENRKVEYRFVPQ